MDGFIMKSIKILTALILLVQFVFSSGCSKSSSSDEAKRNPILTESKSKDQPPAESGTNKSISIELRAGISCDNKTVQTAIELKLDGWVYIMPQPKSLQASWGNPDIRTTWWVGYWTNESKNVSSSILPTNNAAGEFVGDGNGVQSWRHGGSPSTPAAIEWLCSKSGGIPPH